MDQVDLVASGAHRDQIQAPSIILKLVALVTVGSCSSLPPSDPVGSGPPHRRRPHPDAALLALGGPPPEPDPAPPVPDPASLEPDLAPPASPELDPPLLSRISLLLCWLSSSSPLHPAARSSPPHHLSSPAQAASGFDTALSCAASGSTPSSPPQRATTRPCRRAPCRHGCR